MCKLLNEEVKEGSSKKSQLKHWYCYFHWIKDGHKFIIKEIYDEPLPFEDGRLAGNKAIYVRLIEWLLAQDLSKREGYSHTLTRQKWWELLGMINSRYSNITTSNIRLISELHTDKEIQWFYNRAHSVLNSILRDALKSMCDRSLIDYEIQTVIVRPEHLGGWFLAGEKELAELQTVRKDILEKLGVSSETRVFYKNMQEEYYRDVCKIIYEKHGWERYFKQIKIIFNPQNVKRALPELEREIRQEAAKDVVEKKKIELNTEVINRINRDAEHQYNKVLEKYFNGNSGFLLPENYLDAQKSLTYYLIDLKSMTEDVSMKTLLQDGFKKIDDLFSDILNF